MMLYNNLYLTIANAGIIQTGTKSEVISTSSFVIIVLLNLQSPKYQPRNNPFPLGI